VKFRVTIEPDEDGMFVAECPALPGCISQGKTRDEAMVNIRDAIQGYLESLKKHGEPIPAPITEAVVEVLSKWKLTTLFSTTTWVRRTGARACLARWFRRRAETNLFLSAD
jgi:antitoxin HicB